MASQQDTATERRPEMCLSIIEEFPLYRALRDVTLSVGPASSRDPDCSICYLDFEKRDVLLQHTSCGMSYHLHCAFGWLTDSTSCPLCRAHIRDAEQDPETWPFGDFAWDVFPAVYFLPEMTAERYDELVAEAMRELIPEKGSYNESLLAEEEESVQERRAMSHAFDFDAERRSQDLISGSDNASQAPPGEVDQRLPQPRALRPSRVLNHLYRPTSQ